MTVHCVLVLRVTPNHRFISLNGSQRPWNFFGIFAFGSSEETFISILFGMWLAWAPLPETEAWMSRDRRFAIAWWISCWKRSTFWQHSSSYKSFLKMAETIRPFASENSFPIQLNSLPISSLASTLSEVPPTSVSLYTCCANLWIWIENYWSNEWHWQFEIITLRICDQNFFLHFFMIWNHVYNECLNVVQLARLVS